MTDKTEKTNPLLRTPGRELRRHAVEVGAAALALVAVVGATAGSCGGAHPASPATTEATDTAETSVETTATSEPGPVAPTTVTRTQSVQCDKGCTLTVTATGQSDVQLTINGSLTDSQPLGADSTSSTVQVTGTGTIQAAATATGWVELSVTDKNGQQP